MPRVWLLRPVELERALNVETECVLLSQRSQHDPEPRFASASSRGVSVRSMTALLTSEGHASRDAEPGRESAPAWPTEKQRLSSGAGQNDALAGGVAWASMKGRVSNPDASQEAQA